MAFDEAVAKRLRRMLSRRKGITEKKMFGGLCFLHHGNMCCGVNREMLVLRLGKDGVEEAIRERHTREMDFTGTPLSTMIYVTPKGYATDDELKAWVERAMRFVKTLPPK